MRYFYHGPVKVELFHQHSGFTVLCPRVSFRQNLQNLKNSRAVTCFGNAPFSERDFRGLLRLGTGVAYSVFIKNNPAVGIKLTNLGEGVSLGRLGCFFILLPSPIHLWLHRESPPLGEPVSGESGRCSDGLRFYRLFE